MKKTLLISAALVIAAAPLAFAQDASSVLTAAQEAMGLDGATLLSITANGTMKDTGEAAGGNSPWPIVASYDMDLDLVAPGMRLRIIRTNPDGSALTYGTTELQFVSGEYVWQRFSSGAPAGGGGGGGAPPGGAAPDGGAPGGAAPGGAAPGGAAPGGAAPGGAAPGGAAPGGAAPDGAAPGGAAPGGAAPGGGGGGAGGFPGAQVEPPASPEDTFEGGGNPIILTGVIAEARQVQIGLTPAGFVALALENDATASAQGDGQEVSFTTSAGLAFVGTFDGQNLLTGVSTTNPLSGEVLEASFGAYQTFGDITYPSSLVQTEAGEEVVNLTVTDVTTEGVVEITVPQSVIDFEG